MSNDIDQIRGKVMGLSSLTRYALFLESGDYLESGNGIIQFKNSQAVRDMYYDSAILIRGFEDIINTEDNFPLNNKDYKGILRLFNEKGVAAEVGRLLGVENSEYQRKVIKLLKGECHDELVAAMRLYLPNEIPDRIENQ